jgi:hypothetical protein
MGDTQGRQSGPSLVGQDAIDICPRPVRRRLTLRGSVEKLYLFYIPTGQTAEKERQPRASDGSTVNC